MPYSSIDYTMSPNGHTLVRYAKAELSLCSRFDRKKN